MVLSVLTQAKHLGPHVMEMAPSSFRGPISTPPRQLASGVDFLVATPHRLQIHLQKRNVVFSDVEVLVIDEADTLCDTFYEKDICRLLSRMNKAAPPQVVLVGATRTGAVTNFISRSLAVHLTHIVSEDSHTVPANLEQRFVPTRGKMRRNVLAEILQERGVGEKTLIFTNTVRSCRSLRQYLVDALGENVDALHGHMSPRRRAQIVGGFRGRGAAESMTGDQYLASLLWSL